MSVDGVHHIRGLKRNRDGNTYAFIGESDE
jgi:hypothetical protein